MIKASTIKVLVDGVVKTAQAAKEIAVAVEGSAGAERAAAEVAGKAVAAKPFSPKAAAAATEAVGWSAKAVSAKAVPSASAVAQLQELDVMLRDVDSLRVVLTTDARPADVLKLANEGGRLLELNRELRALDDLSLASTQTTSEVARVIKSLTSTASGRKGIFLSKEGAAVDLQGPADLAAASRAAKTKAPKGFGEGVAVGVDPATGARVVLQPKGAVIEDLPLMAFVKLRGTRAQGAEAAKRLAADDASLASLRTLSDVELEAKGLRSMGGPTEYVTLAGKAPEDNALTFPTRWHKEAGDLAPRRMVVEGPFRGSYLDDIVGRLDQDALQARLQDSRAKWLSPKNSPLQPIISTIDVKQGGEVVTKLRMRIPSGSEWTSVRQSLSKLSEKLPTVQKVNDSKGTLFVFSPNDFKFMRSVTRSFALSPEAEVVRAKQIAKLTEFENISSPLNLKEFSAAKIDGLKTTSVDPSGRTVPFELSQPQRVELARLAHNNYRDVVTLGTGLGKTVVALSALRKINLAGEVRPFLVVVPKGNEGTFLAQLQTHFTPAAAKEMAAKLEIMNYDQFRAASRTGKLPGGEEFNSKRYGAVVFDEVHNASDRNTAAGRAVLKFGHPRTIEMTGTPNPDPQRLQTMLAGTQGVDLASPAARQARLEAKRFRTLMYEEVNGIPVGIKGPTELRPGLSVDFDQQLLEWLKVNFYYVDGLDSKLGLPNRHAVKMMLPMSEELEQTYRMAAAPVRKGLEGLLSIHRDKGMDLIDPTKRTAQSKGSAVHEIIRSQKKEVAQLDKLTNTPEKLQATGKMFRERLVADEARGAEASRALLFSDDPAYVLASAEQLSKDVPGKYHLAALADRVEVFQNGKRLTQLGPYQLPFRPGAYELNGVTLPAQQWRSFAVEQLPKLMPDIASATLHGPTHQSGLNMQWGNMVVHLDRDSWSDLNLRQREARALRRGQTRDVTVVNVDYHYAAPKHTLDSPLDAVREAFANTERRLHEATLARAQKVKTTADLAPTRDSAAFDPTAWADLTYLSAGANPVPGAVSLIGAGP